MDLFYKKDLFFRGNIVDMQDERKHLTHTLKSTFAAIIYDLEAINEKGSYPYCTILEVYSPEFLSLVELEQIYPELKRLQKSAQET